MFWATISFVSLWRGLGKVIVKTGNIHLRPLRHLPVTVRLFFPSLAIQLYTVLDKSMIGFFSADSYVENGYYEQAQGIIKSCLVLVSSMVTVMSPKISYCYASGNRKKMSDYLYESYRYVWLITIILCITIYIVSPKLIPLFLGKGFEKTVRLVQICSPLFIIIGLSNVTGLQYFVPTDHIKEHTSSLLVGSFVNIVLNSLLIPRFQSEGATIASVVAEFCVTTTQFVFVTKINDFQVRKILYLSGKYIIAGILTGIFIVFLDMWMGMTLGFVVLEILFSVVTYVVLLLLMKDKIMHRLIKEGLHLIKGKVL